MVVSDYLTWIAEAIVEQVCQRAWLMLTSKHGNPPACDAQHSGFAVIGFGKFGGIELGYGSDLDLVFLQNCADGDALTEGEKPISCAQFYLRLAQKVRHIFDTRMLSGILYETDLRLRPNGDSGVLVPHIGHYLAYYQQHAWTWEHQALVRARFIAGDTGLAEIFAGIRQQVLAIPRCRETLKNEVRAMREKMRAHLGSKDDAVFDLKHSQGGITDIEFMVQFSVLDYAATHPELTRYTDNIRLLDSLRQAGLITIEDAELLKKAYCSFRDLGHHLVLQDQAALADANQLIELRSAVEQLWQAVMV